MNVRLGTEKDISAYLAIQEAEWGEKMMATRHQLLNRYDQFPEGFIISEKDGSMMGAVSLIRLAEYDFKEQKSWDDICDRGWGNTHNSNGNVMFGVDLSVSKLAPRSAAQELVRSALEATMAHGAEALYWGSRIPRYFKHSKTMTPDEYLNSKTGRGRFRDPEIEFYSNIPGVEILGIVPDYFKDWNSGDNGVILRWGNPIYRYPFLRRFSNKILDGFYYLHNR